MFTFTRHVVEAKARRIAAVAAVLGAASLVVPAQAVHAQTAGTVPLPHAVAASLRMPITTVAATAADRAKRETIDDRIAGLHAALKITADEEPRWSAVAQTMRDNEAAMHKLATEKRAAAPGTMTAIDDLKAYQTFAQTHVDGLTRLISSFEALYTAMPDSQKTTANQVFATFGSRAATGRK